MNIISDLTENGNGAYKDEEEAFEDELQISTRQQSTYREVVLDG